VAERISVREAVIALGFVERGELTEAQLDDCGSPHLVGWPAGVNRAA